MRKCDRLLLWGAILGCHLTAVTVVEPVLHRAGASDPPAKLQLDEPPTGLQFEDPPESLMPMTGRTAAESDRLEALAMFSAARMNEHQGNDAQALRLYQRALRHDPDSLAILRQIVPLALKLNRIDEFLRYALKIADLDPSNSALLRQLADHLASQGRFSSAVALYEKELEQRNGGKKSGSLAVLLNQMGRLYFLDGSFDKAAETFAKVVEALDAPEEYGLRDSQRKAILGDAPRTYQLFGATFLQAGQLDRAAAAFANAHESAPDESVHSFRLAQIAHRRDQPAEALEHLQVYLDARKSTEGTEPYALLAELLGSLDLADQVEPRLTQLHEDDPDNLPLAHYLAEQHLKADRWDQAEPIYRRLLEQIRSDSLPPEPSVADFRGQKGAVYRAKAQAALRGLAEIYRRTENVDQLFSILGHAAQSGGGLDILGPEAAAIVEDESLLGSLIDHARGRRDAAPDDFGYGPALAVGTLALEAERVEVAGEFFAVAVDAEEKTADETLLTWGLGLLMIDQYAAAAKVFQRAIDAGRMPDDPRYHYFLSGALEMVGDTDQALAAAREAASLASDDPRVVSRVGWVLYHAKRYAEAYEAYTDLIENFDRQRNSPEIRDALRNARLVLSNISVIQVDLGQAEEWLAQVLDEFPEDISALNDLGYLWADQNKHLDRALVMIQQAVAAEPDNVAYRDSLGWVFYRLGRHEEAVVELERAVEGDDPDGVILDHLGDSLQAAGQPDEALATWQQALDALDAADDPDRVQQIRDKIESAYKPSPAETTSP